MANKKKTRKTPKAKPVTRGRTSVKSSSRGKAKKSEGRGKKLPDLVGDRYIILSADGEFLTSDLEFNESLHLSKIMFYKDKPAAKKHLHTLIDELEAQDTVGTADEATVQDGPFSKVIPETIITAAVIQAKKVLATSYSVDINSIGVPSIKYGITFKNEATPFKAAVKDLTAVLKKQANEKIQEFRSMQAEHRRLESLFEKTEVALVQKQLNTFSKKIGMYA